MLAFLLRRLGHAIPVLIGVTLVAFLLIHLVPGDPARLMVGARASDARVHELREDLGLERPLPAQYAGFVAGAVTGDLGDSVVQGRAVGSLIGERLGPTMLLLLYTTLLTAVLALALGTVSAVRAGGRLDALIRLGTLFAFAMPGFWLALLLVRWLSLDLGIFPVSGYGDGLLGRLESLTLPAVVLSAFLLSVMVRSLRSSLMEALRSDYTEAARARGASGRRIVLHHALRNALIPSVTVLAINVGFLLSGAVVVEQIFDIPGLGQLLVQSINTRDYTVLQGLALTFGVVVIAINLLADLAYAAIDPRVRLQS